MIFISYRGRDNGYRQIFLAPSILILRTQRYQ